MNERKYGTPNFDYMDSHGKEGYKQWLREKYRSPEEIERMNRKHQETDHEKW